MSAAERILADVLRETFEPSRSGLRPSSPLVVPESVSFAEIAEGLRTYSEHEAAAAEGMRVFVARNPGRALDDVLLAARRSARVARILHLAFRALVPHEELVRDFVAGLFDPSPSGVQEARSGGAAVATGTQGVAA